MVFESRTNVYKTRLSFGSAGFVVGDAVRGLTDRMERYEYHHGHRTRFVGS